MTQEEKQLLLKDLCARLPYRVMIKSVGENKIIGLWDLKDTDNLPLPYLRHMSSMTEEEKDERDQIVTTVYNGEVIDDAFVNIVQYMDWLNAHHFDFHNLIEKGLAFEAKEGMYKIE